MSICVRYITPGDAIGTANGVTVTANTYILEPTGQPPCGVDAFELQTEATASPWNLDYASAGAIGGALLLVMAAAWSFRQVIETVRQSSKGEDT